MKYKKATSCPIANSQHSRTAAKHVDGSDGAVLSLLHIPSVTFTAVCILHVSSICDMDVDPDYACFEIDNDEGEKPGPPKVLENSGNGVNHILLAFYRNLVFLSS